MFTLAGFYSSLPQNSAYAQLNAIQDQSLPQNSANQFIMPDNFRIIAAMGQGITTSRMQIQAPSMRQIAYPEIYPIIQAAITSEPDSTGYQFMGDNGPRVMANESLGVYASENNTGASPTICGLWLAKQIAPLPPGQIITLVATASITTIVQTWVAKTLTFETVLAAGNYSIVGMACYGSGINFARLVFPGNVNMRPGVPAETTYGRKNWRDSFRFGRIGKFGDFVFNAPPQLEVLGSAAATVTYTCLLDVIKTS